MVDCTRPMIELKTRHNLQGRFRVKLLDWAPRTCKQRRDPFKMPRWADICFVRLLASELSSRRPPNRCREKCTYNGGSTGDTFVSMTPLVYVLHWSMSGDVGRQDRTDGIWAEIKGSKMVGKLEQASAGWNKSHCNPHLKMQQVLLSWLVGLLNSKMVDHMGVEYLEAHDRLRKSSM